MPKLLIVIPAYNEEGSIERVVDDLIQNYPQYDYVVVNDGSRDRTLGAFVLGRALRGKLGAQQRAVLQGARADGSHARAERGGHALAVDDLELGVGTFLGAGDLKDAVRALGGV